MLEEFLSRQSVATVNNHIGAGHVATGIASKKNIGLGGLV